MLKISKKFLFYALLIISSITLLNLIVLYWFPIQVPLCSYLATNLMVTAYIIKAYYLIPICFSICILMLCTAFAFLKEQLFLPVTLFVYLWCDLFFLSYSFFDAWFNDSHFIAVQAIQILINISVITFMCIYFVTRKKVVSSEGQSAVRNY